ncbi:diaminopimelate epimerase [Streptomyces sp. NBC_00094]|uniref:diaminopimelate epimerase n=1 Tax=Streptomyces sp. NBC_00094 TaxID=2903620 RepID=UPI002259B818|nr:diaminopimelate epimerase [Streptomyces sp. NBC_00094]MCX5391990.1 diaminopimelate epimerase [Streptomyces sp. NBC_00094]
MNDFSAHSVFSTYHALGNDYVVIDPRDSDFTPGPEAVRLLCDRHFGVGADGVLFGPLQPPVGGEPVDLRMFNSDGTECEKSGNGLRMFALYLAEAYAEPWSANGEFLLRTAAGDVPVRILDLAAGLVRVGMGRPELGELGETLDAGGRRLAVTTLNNGNPHAVVPLEEVSADLARELGPLIAGHPRFPNRTNVQFMQVIDRRTLAIEVYERGAGYTLASGSSACAAASAAHALGLIDGDVEVRMPGGRLDVVIDADGAVTMSGTAERITNGTFSPAFRDRLVAAR